MVGLFLGQDQGGDYIYLRNMEEKEDEGYFYLYYLDIHHEGEPFEYFLEIDYSLVDYLIDGLHLQKINEEEIEWQID